MVGEKISADLLNTILTIPRSLSAPEALCAQRAGMRSLASMPGKAFAKPRKDPSTEQELEMSTSVQGELRKRAALVLDWLMFATSVATIAWISFRTIGG
jgi:hypothetical protein